MKQGLYRDDGYLSIPFIINQGQTFNFIIGARGTGKTYGMLEYCYDNGIMFLYLRRTQAVCDTVCSNDLSIWKQFATDRGLIIKSRNVTKQVYGFFVVNDDDTETLIGYGGALTTISNIRGVGLADIKVLVYDEFIPEDHAKPIKNEGAAFKNAYETINRNRELTGEPPLICVCFSNSDNIASPILGAFDLIRIFANLQKTGRFLSVSPTRSICAINMQNSPISGKKSQTALYKALPDEDSYKNMALDNSFGAIEKGVKSRPLKEYVPLCTIQARNKRITVHRHKSRNEYYISGSGNAPDYYTADTVGLRCLWADYGYLWDRYARGAVLAESVECRIIFEDIFAKL